MATFIEDGRLIVEDDGARYDLTHDLRKAVTALADVRPILPSARMGVTLQESAHDIGNMFGWFDQPDEVAEPDAPATVFILVQTDEDDGSEASAWAVINRATITDARHEAEEIVQILKENGLDVEQLEDSAPWRGSVRDASTGEVRDGFHAPPGARGPDDPRDVASPRRPALERMREIVNSPRDADGYPVGVRLTYEESFALQAIDSLLAAHLDEVLAGGTW
jgi:hypothetical protein